MLLMMKSYTEGIRALILYTSYCMDRERMAQDAVEKAKWSALIAFLTPVAKAYGSDMSFRVTETAVQVYGGYGYMMDFPVEQFLRDEKVHSLFEGTNGIQSLDLAGRKLARDGKILSETLFEEIKQFCIKNTNDKIMGSHIKTLEAAIEALMDVSSYLADLCDREFDSVALQAVSFMELFGDVVTGWLLLWQSIIAGKKLEAIIEKKGLKGSEAVNEFISNNSDAAFYSGKQASASYFAGTVLMQAGSKAHVIKNCDRTAIKMAEKSF
jgi:hypothetical protein